MQGNKKVIERKLRFLECLKEAGGMATVAADNAGINFATYRRWVNSDPEFAEAVEEPQERTTDYVESKLLQRIEDGDTTAMIFYLKTKGRKRGWSEKHNLLNDRTAGKSQGERPLVTTAQLEKKVSYLRKLMEEAGTYADVYSAQITLTASLLVQADAMRECLATQSVIITQTSREGDTRQIVNPVQKALLDTLERAQRGLRALGMNLDSKERKPDSDGYTDFMSRFNEEDDEEDTDRPLRPCE